jgi:hypothetical protein
LANTNFEGDEVAAGDQVYNGQRSYAPRGLISFYQSQISNDFAWL